VSISLANPCYGTGLETRTMQVQKNNKCLHEVADPRRATGPLGPTEQ
jgi:hypothetical protein